ncbi:hypothetical protein ABVK25_004927 [Lepraria finkii]|uniref:Uncharacterized protein n=1 Tax=Lepraria finkii TaxID=1340010 RepID=A0ABR4B9U6_9LECA
MCPLIVLQHRIWGSSSAETPDHVHIIKHETTPFFNGIAVIFVVTTGLESTCDAQPQARGQQHSDIRVRVIQKPSAGSGSSILREGTDNFVNVPPFPTEAPTGVKCTGRDYGLLDTTHESKVFTRIKPVPQADSHTSYPRQDPTVVLPTRRRLRLQSLRTSSDIGPPTGVEQGSISSPKLLTKSSCGQTRVLFLDTSANTCLTVIVPSVISGTLPTLAADGEDDLYDHTAINARAQTAASYLQRSRILA